MCASKTSEPNKSLESWIWDAAYSIRSSSNGGTNKEKTVRQWFMGHAFIESVLYLPENHFDTPLTSSSSSTGTNPRPAREGLMARCQ